MWINDYTLTETKQINTGDVIILKLSAFGISPSFNYNLEQAIKKDDVVRFIDIKKEIGSSKAIIRIVSKANYDTPKYIINYIETLANSWDIKGIFLFNVKVESIQTMEYEEARKQFKLEEEQAQKRKEELYKKPSSIVETLFGEKKPLSESLFGFSGTHITIIVLGLGAFLIWTKLPSLKGR